MADEELIDDAMIDHIDRCWRAECENAERITKERHLLLTILIAFLGFGLFKIDWLQGIVAKIELPTPWGTRVEVAIAIALAVAIILFIASLFSLAHKPKSSTASSRLTVPYTARDMPDNIVQRRLVFSLTNSAFTVLLLSNQKLRRRLKLAWSFFGYGISIVGLAIVLYIGAKVATILRSEVPHAASQPATRP